MTARGKDVVVTGVGLISAAGDSPERVHRLLAAGETALTPARELEERGLPPVPAAPIRDFDAAAYLGKRSLRPLDRTARLAASAAQQALAASGLDGEEGPRPVGLVLGTMFGSIETISEFDHRAVSAGPQYAKPMQFANSVINAAAGQTAIWHRLAGINATISGGGASGVQAIGYAADQIRAGRAEVLLAGGAEELSFPALYGFHRQGRFWNGNGTGPCSVPFDRRRNGMAPAEAAALLVLETRASAEARGARPLAWLGGHGAGFDPSRGASRERARAAMSTAIRRALEESELDRDDVAAVSAAANGGADDGVEAEALLDVFGGGRPAVTAVKASLGESLGAAGAVQTALLIEALTAGVLPGIAGLEWPEPVALELLGAARPIPAGPGLVTAAGLRGKAAALVVWPSGSAS